MATVNEVAECNFEKLDMFTLAITRAHGKNHPEAFEVRNIFNTMKEKTIEAGTTGKPHLEEEFTQLRKVTSNYTIPGDVCGTYAGVYNMLFEADQAYHA
ncbi:MAG: iron-sulfur cluster repair di-iron protein, ric [Carnobacterium inhibens]|uniref:iron-sulfur cluster repair di-iron protein, ric n=1 Tax=Carnobacterium inhibens TaxID=147709 RepID=UPI0033145212